MSKLLNNLSALIQVSACTKAQNYDPATKVKSDKKTADGKQVYELHCAVKTKVKKGEIELEELNYEKLNSLIELQPGEYNVTLEMFEILDRASKKTQTYFRVTGLAQHAVNAAKKAA